VDVVAKSLAKHGFDTAPIHGDLDQSLRMKTLEKFRSGELKILVASDVAARGLDVPAVSHVFNFDVPIHADDYVHRIGRTGRAGRSGAAYMLASHRDGKYIEAIEKVTGQKLARREMMDIEVREESRPHRDKDRGGRGGRDRDRGRGRDGKHRDRRPPDGKYHDQVASLEPTESKPAVEAPQPAARPEKPRHEPRHEPRQEQRSDHRSEHRSEHREKRGPRGPHKPQGQQPEAVDKSELPAFLFRPVPVKKPVPQS
jgi:superfamily II DNA/RNA helicase